MRTIRVTGKGQIKVRPDMTRITVTLTGLYKEYSETLRRSSADTEALKDVLAEFGFERPDLKTLSFNVDTEYESYSTLGLLEDKTFRKLKLESNYVRDQFVRRQTIVSQDEVDRIIKAYSKYTGYISGRTRNTIVGIGATTVVAVATGGLALTFAPGIAAAIAGEAVVGLHGAALSSASLAFVGGGSLAAGGLGVAGGTAIITGGGALIGLAGTGSVTAATVLLQTPSEYWVRQSAKLLTYSNCVLSENLHDNHSVAEILQQIEIAIAKTEKEVAEIDAEKSDLDKELLKKTEEYLKYLARCRSELQRIIKGK